MSQVEVEVEKGQLCLEGKKWKKSKKNTGRLKKESTYALVGRKTKKKCKTVGLEVKFSSNLFFRLPFMLPLKHKACTPRAIRNNPSPQTSTQSTETEKKTKNGESVLSLGFGLSS